MSLVEPERPFAGKAMLRIITNNFALLTVAGVGLAWIFPPAFTWMTDGSIRLAGQPLLSLALGVVMLAMGLTLTFADYRALAQMPRALLVGVGLQFLVMPLSGFAIASALDLEPGLAVGLILVACCPGGTASNIVTFIARGNVALSVAMTMASTLAAVALTPLLTGALAGAYVAIDRLNLLLNMVGIVLVPVVLGTLLNRLFPRAAARVSAGLPVMAIVLVIWIVGGIVGGAKAQIIAHAGTVLLATFLLHASGFALGYVLAKVLGLDEVAARTISIEVGMQNSGLGSGLAKTPAFAAQFANATQAALAPVPAAISAVWHVVIGSLLAGWWRRRG
ncbi:bile acid:sodium symporter family protein [Erythrobacter cryptus]|uniref:bile acid:sodium symporter family protein n=1 Tax=Erythrobacter cryptus TaxID=196588 RepID=UPI001FDF7BE6|nr:bile acid:sodium symporter family protein [Erythrobacter cryptus]GIX21210.1 MAG: transporter [Erythrobacter sp.]